MDSYTLEQCLEPLMVSHELHSSVSRTALLWLLVRHALHSNCHILRSRSAGRSPFGLLQEKHLLQKAPQRLQICLTLRCSAKSPDHQAHQRLNTLQRPLKISGQPIYGFVLPPKKDRCETLDHCIRAVITTQALKRCFGHLQRKVLAKPLTEGVNGTRLVAEARALGLKRLSRRIHCGSKDGVYPQLGAEPPPTGDGATPDWG